MAEKFKKIDKEFLLTDDSVNSYGYRLLSSGYQLADFEKNPIGYFMHKREDGVLLRWTDFRQDGDKVYAKPMVNLSNQRGQQTADEIESGFLNAASCGHFVVLETSDDPALKLPGQTGPTVTKWYNREASLVDIPGNYNAVAELFDADGNAIENLADFFQNKNPKMEKILFTAAQLAALNLKADADTSAVEIALNDLVAKAAKVEGLEKQISDLTAKNETIAKSMSKTLVDGHIAKGIADKKFGKGLADKLAETYADKPKELEDLIALMPAFQSVTEEINKSNAAGSGTKKDLVAEWDAADKDGSLEDLKANDPAHFKDVFKAKFGTEYTGK